MRDDDKPFVMYRRGPWNFTIAPRGAKGWMQFGLWMALLAPPTIGFVLYAEAREGRSAFYVAFALYMLFTLVWTLAGIWWMKACAEVVDVEAMLRQKREAERRTQCGRPQADELSHR